ncbi:MAG: hypothetical protein EOO57_05120 [Hymenobacter sp.]|nr:MAG: hypothetical protein EOO57_05120 [Hymenobacter sp.]
MKKNWVWLLALGLAACGKPLEIAPDVALKHQNDAAFQRQVQLLQAEQIKVSAAAAGPAGPAVLMLEVLNPRHQPENPDSLKQRVRQLAHLLVADLARPDRYQVVNAQATFKQSRFSLGGGQSSSQAFIYPIASLR